MHQVICFYWQGDRWSDTAVNKELYGNLESRVGLVDSILASRYINNLFKGVYRFAPEDFEFTCFTNATDLNLHPAIKVHSFDHKSIGVLPRMYMFSKESGLFGNQVLCLDLDVIITASLKPFFKYKGLFCTRTKFKPSQAHKLDGDIMSFRACAENEKRFWQPFKEDVKFVEAIANGRERYWIRYVVGNKTDTWREQAPGAVASWKWDIAKAGLKPSNAIISCHGYPRPHQIDQQWIKEYWT